MKLPKWETKEQIFGVLAIFYWKLCGRISTTTSSERTKPKPFSKVNDRRWKPRKSSQISRYQRQQKQTEDNTIKWVASWRGNLLEEFSPFYLSFPIRMKLQASYWLSHEEKVVVMKITWSERYFIFPWGVQRRLHEKLHIWFMKSFGENGWKAVRKQNLSSASSSRISNTLMLRSRSPPKSTGISGDLSKKYGFERGFVLVVWKFSVASNFKQGIIWYYH